MSSELIIIDIQKKIHDLRGQRVMLDFELAEYFGIETRILNQAVKRNLERFPGEDFMFQLGDSEVHLLESQSVIRKRTKGGARTNPYAFTEKGTWSVCYILNSEKAIERGIQLIRALEKLRDFAQTKLTEVPGATQHLLSSPTSIVNHFHAPVVIQQGNQNTQINITRESVITEALLVKSETEDKAMMKLIQDLADQLATKDQKTTIQKTFSLIEKGAGAATALAKFCEKVGPYIHHLHW